MLLFMLMKMKNFYRVEKIFSRNAPVKAFSTFFMESSAVTNIQRFPFISFQVIKSRMD